jgi:3-oxoacyl-[acyl-carrier-protein] synthase-3
MALLSRQQRLMIPFPQRRQRFSANLGRIQAFAFDVQAVCAGFIYALDVADAMIKSGKAKRIVNHRGGSL